MFVWLSREQTLVAAAATLVDHANGQLALDGVSGSLLRPIHVEHAALKNGRYEFVLENTTFRWSPLWLFAGVVAFEPVSVERARIVSGAGGNEPVQPPQSLATPVKLRLERASIDRLTIVRGDVEREIGPLTLDVHAGAKSLMVGIEPAQTPWGRLTMRADIANEPPFALNGKLDLERTGEHPLAAHVDATGELYLKRVAGDDVLANALDVREKFLFVVPRLAFGGRRSSVQIEQSPCAHERA